MSNVTVIALTGGPCGGKSTALSRIEQELSSKGYKVFILNEMATDVINSGLIPGLVSTKSFQKVLIKMQYERLKMYCEIAEEYYDKHFKEVVILCDRGIPDSKAYMSKIEYEDILSELGLDNASTYSLYDGVFNLVTAALGASEFYTLENNKARTETAEEAIIKDNECIQAYTGHNHLRIITNRNKTFEQKMDDLMEEIYSLLGVPVPLEIERKYLIKKPKLLDLSTKAYCVEVKILQTYLKEKEHGVERRIRQREIDNSFTFYYTEKRGVDELTRVESEKIISKEEYLSLMMEADESKSQIIKTRYCFVYGGTYFELDIYNFWNDKAILEVELTSASKKVNIPDFLEVIKEVTEDNDYKNASLALNKGNI